MAKMVEFEIAQNEIVMKTAALTKKKGLPAHDPQHPPKPPQNKHNNTDSDPSLFFVSPSLEALSNIPNLKHKIIIIISFIKKRKRN